MDSAKRVPNGQSPSSGVCPVCPAGCSKCSGSSDPRTCSECLAGYYLSSSKCVKCSENSTNGSNTITGVKDCVSCKEPSGASGTVTCYVTQTPTVDPTDPSVNKSGLSSGAIAGISITVTTIIRRPVDKMSTYIIHTSVSAIVRPIQSPYPSPKTSVADKHSRMPTPATGGSSVPVFTAKDICKRIDSVLGRGSLGTVYSIKGHPGLAVKEVPIDEQDEGSVNTIRSELAALARLSHPGLLRCHQVVEDGSFIYAIVDRYSRTLDGLLIEHKRARTLISGETVFSILRQLADTLAHLHGALVGDASGQTACRTAHRDLKPTSILLSGDGERVAIAHFGRCKDALWPEGAMDGPRPYTAPEVLLEGRATPASDIWALGVIVYELTTLRKPDFLNDQRLEDVFVDGWESDLSAIEDDSMRIILEKIFVLDPVKRPTARSLQELLNPSISSTGMLRLRIASLEDALGAAGARTDALEETVAALKDKIDAQSIEISTLRRDLAIKSSTIDSLKQQFTKAIEDLKQQLAEDAISLRPQTPSTITGHTILSALDSSWTPLMCAAFFGDVEAAKRHLNEMDERNSDGDTAYTLAARAGQGTILELLDPTDEDGVTALIRAAEKNDVEAVRALITKQRKLRDSDGKTALIHAAQRGCKEAVKVLLEHEKKMSDSQNHNALLGSQQWTYKACRDRHALRGPDR